jgi:cytochrome c-type biogenesis protein CcmH/NrfG
LANVYADTNDLPKAERAAATACSLEPGSAEAWLIRGHVALVKGDVAQAEKHARTAIRLRPDGVEPWLALGDALLRAEGNTRAAEAVSAFREAAGRGANPYVLRRLGEALVRAGQAESGVETLRSAAKLAPRDASIAYQLAQALQATGAAKEASEWSDRARKLQDLRYQLIALQRKVQQAPDDSALLAKLARQYLAVGDRPSALDAYKRALALDPDNQELRHALAGLEAGTGVGSD